MYSDEDDEASDAREKSLSLGGENEVEGEDEFNLNMSFSGGYVPNTDLRRVDKG